MTFNYREAGGWTPGRLKVRKDGEWIEVGAGPANGGGVTGGGFNWDQTSTDTSWLYDADASGNLNVEKVTTLNPTGPGSITEAVQANGNAPTVVVFEVGGVIDLDGETYWRMRENNTFLAGQTAPWPGISLIRGGIRVHSDSVIVQHLRFLTGNDVNDPHKARAITIDGTANDVLFDHCTAAWAPDTNVDVHSGKTGRHSIINSIIAEALQYSSHPEAPHAYGLLLFYDSGQTTVMGNLLSHNWRRNPYMQGNSDAAMINNVVYNFGHRAIHLGSGAKSDVDPELTLVSNIFKPGGDTTADEIVAFSGVVYEEGTIIEGDLPMSDGSQTFIDSPEHWPTGLDPADVLPASELGDFLAQNVGPRPAERAPLEERLVNDWQNGRGRIIDDPSDVGGYPDPQPTSRSLDPPSTNLLDWLQQYTYEVESASSA